MTTPTTIPDHWPPLPPGSPPPRAERRAYCQTLMTTRSPEGGMLWVRGGVKGSARLLAAVWGLAPSTLRDDSSVAWDNIKGRIAELDVSELRNKCAADIETARVLARGLAKSDPREAAKLLLQSADATARLTGCAAPRRVDARVTATSTDALDALLFGKEGEE